MPHGFSEKAWRAGRKEGRAAMIAHAKRGQMITYTELVDSIRSVRLEPHDPRLFMMLGGISTEEDAAGRGMLTAIVVHKTGDYLPGTGFFELAKELGKNVSDPIKCRTTEVGKVFDYWKRHR
jgi:hypothetical protein